MTTADIGPSFTTSAVWLNESMMTQETSSSELSPILVFILSIISGIASLFTVLGNLLVLVAFKQEHRLRIVSNYFIFSMAIADLIIGLCSMPSYTSYVLLSYWPFGSVICDIWLSLDFLCCAASVLGILLISIDRYHILSNPMTYRQTMTRRRALLLIFVSWITSAILFSVPIIGWQYFEGKRTVLPGECDVQFFSNPLYTILSIVIIYWLPLVIILILYTKIYMLTRRLVRKEAKIIGRLSTRETTSSRASHQLRPRDVDIHREPVSCDDWDDVAQRMDAPNCETNEYIAQCETKLHDILKSEVSGNTNGCQNHINPSQASPLQRVSPYVKTNSKKQQNFVENLDIRRAKVYSCPINEEDPNYTYQCERTPSSNNKTLYRYSKDGGPSFSKISTESDVELDGERVRMTRPNSSQSLASEKKSVKSVLHMKENNLARTLTSVIMSLKEAKAVRTLSVLLGAFVLCWTPYSVLVIVRACCSNTCVNDNLFSFSYYLCYINSTFNPLCYAMSNRGFRIAFKRILTCGKRRYEWKETF